MCFSPCVIWTVSKAIYKWNFTLCKQYGSINQFVICFLSALVPHSQFWPLDMLVLGKIVTFRHHHRGHYRWKDILNPTNLKPRLSSISFVKHKGHMMKSTLMAPKWAREWGQRRSSTAISRRVRQPAANCPKRLPITSDKQAVIV